MIQETKEKLDPNQPPPYFSTDSLTDYSKALFREYSQEVKEERREPGQPRKEPKRILAAELNYGRLLKRRRKNRMVKVEREVVFGKMEVSSISSSIIERDNLTVRMTNGRMVRKTIAFSKSLEDHRNAQILYDAVYNFAKPHKGLRVRLEQPQGSKKWLQRTPAMAAGIASAVWSLAELSSYVVSPLLLNLT